MYKYVHCGTLGSSELVKIIHETLPRERTRSHRQVDYPKLKLFSNPLNCAILQGTDKSVQ